MERRTIPPGRKGWLDGEDSKDEPDGDLAWGVLPERGAAGWIQTNHEIIPFILTIMSIMLPNARRSA